MSGNSSNSMRTPLGRVRGHGASHEGTGHFIALRITSIALLFLLPWFIISAALSSPAPITYIGAIDFLAEPLNAVGATLLLVIGLYHMSLGMQEVIVDYIHKPFTKAVLLLLNTLVPIALGAGAIFAVLQINFGG